ncbi:MAG: hypothetical protein R2809_08605 [Flavobacteriales bacterium]
MKRSAKVVMVTKDINLRRKLKRLICLLKITKQASEGQLDDV